MAYTAPDKTGGVGLRVLVYHEVDGTTTDLLFSQFPIRIGRNPLNELVLNHQYVSQWHAVIRLENQVLSLVQVGSSNSVLVGDHHLSTNEEIALHGNEVLRIVPFRIDVQLVALPHTLRQQSGGSLSSYQTVPDTANEQQVLEQIALRVLDRMAGHFLGAPLQDAREVAAFGAQIEETIDVFLRFFVALQKGQEQFRQAFDIKALQGGKQNPIEQARDAAELAGLLFHREGAQLFGGEGAVRSLEHAFKNVMIHQVALLNGLMAGVRTLLAKLSPKAVAKEAARAHRSPSVKVIWQTFERIHQDLAEEDNEAFETIFGPQFSRAYAALVGTKVGKK